MKFEERILLNSVRFTDMEDDIIAYLLEYQDIIDEVKITSLAKRFFTSPNTVVRLAHKLGYSGFSELKYLIKQENKYTNYDNEDKSALLKNFEIVDTKDNYEILEQLINATRINFYSIGQTAYVTKVVVDNFYSIDYKSFFYNYPNELNHVITHGNNEVIFFISLSGQKEQLLKLAHEAKNYGHTIITLTHLNKNALTSMGDFNLFCFSPEQRIEEYNVTDKTPILLIMNNLFKQYARRLGKTINIV